MSFTSYYPMAWREPLAEFMNLYRLSVVDFLAASYDSKRNTLPLKCPKKNRDKKTYSHPNDW